MDIASVISLFWLRPCIAIVILLSFLLIFSFDPEDTAEGLLSGHPRPEDAKKVFTPECPESGLTVTTDAVIRFTNVNALYIITKSMRAL